MNHRHDPLIEQISREAFHTDVRAESGVNEHASVADRDAFSVKAGANGIIRHLPEIA